MSNKFKPKITLFHCINTFNESDFQPVFDNPAFDLKIVKLPCSSMVKEVFLLKAFEAGADAVAVMVCPEGTCRYVEGNTRANKRVQRTKKLLDQIGLDHRRLSLYNISHGDTDEAVRVIMSTISFLNDLGPNPAHKEQKAK